MNKIVIGILIVIAATISGCIKQVAEEMQLKINFYENGKMISLDEIKELTDILLNTLKRLNLQAKCVFDEERIKKIKTNNEVIELIFNKSRDITISQWIKPEERNHIKTDKNGYRILENVKVALFILKDNLNEGLEGHVLVGHEFKNKITYTCWAIQQRGSKELYKSWVNEVLNLIKFYK